MANRSRSGCDQFSGRNNQAASRLRSPILETDGKSALCFRPPADNGPRADPRGYRSFIKRPPAAIAELRGERCRREAIRARRSSTYSAGTILHSAGTRTQAPSNESAGRYGVRLMACLHFPALEPGIRFRSRTGSVAPPAITWA